MPPVVRTVGAFSRHAGMAAMRGSAAVGSLQARFSYDTANGLLIKKTYYERGAGAAGRRGLTRRESGPVSESA